jgi:hypothetical protein
MRDLPIDKRGYPVPFFVEWINGAPEFRVASRGKLDRCVLLKLCWICGKPLGNRLVAFTIGPMCAINRISSEPPQHPECAEFAARACPFLTMPKMERRMDNLPAKLPPPGQMIERNPGVTLIWLTRRWELDHQPTGYLFHIGAPIKAMWYAEGRKAQRSEVLDSIRSGLPVLLSQIASKEDMAEMDKRYDAAMRLLPKEVRA